MSYDLEKKKESDRMDLPCLIAEQFCISLASVLSFLENLTICFFNPGLNNKRQTHKPLHQMHLLSLKYLGFPPPSLFLLLINCEIGKPIIFRYLHNSEWLFKTSCKNKLIKDNSFTNSNSSMSDGYSMMNSFISIAC